MCLHAPAMMRNRQPIVLVAPLINEKNKHFNSGIYSLRKAVSLNPSDGKLRYRLGAMQFKLVESSENNFFPVNKFLYLNRAAYQLELAEETFKFPALNFLRAYCQELMKNKKNAYAEYSKVFFYDPGDTKAIKRRAWLSIRNKKPEVDVR